MMAVNLKKKKAEKALEKEVKTTNRLVFILLVFALFGFCAFVYEFFRLFS